MKNPNGFGSITKLSGKRRKPYLVRGKTIYIKKKETRPIIGYYATRPEAIIALAEYAKAPTTKINITLKALYEEWQGTRAYTDLSKDTQNNYTASWNKRLQVLGGEPVKDLRTGQLQKIIDDAETAGKSRSSISKDKALMTILFDYALQNDIVHKNYASFVELPSGEGESTRDAFTEMERLKIEEAAKIVPFADCILMLCYTGFRIQEFLTLTPFSYDEKAQTLIGGMKTEAGKGRVVPISPKISKYVKAWAEKGGDTLICKEDGTGYRVKHFRESCYAPALESIEGVRKLTPHNCRHTFATMLHHAGVDPLEIKRLMGHTKIEMSMKYTHTDLERLKNAVSAL